MTAIQATFHNTKRIASRKTYQIILEVPEEHQAHVHEVLGYPNSGESTWCAIARLAPPDERPQAREPDQIGE